MDYYKFIDIFNMNLSNWKLCGKLPKGNIENDIVDHGNETHLKRLHKSENNECQYICTYDLELNMDEKWLRARTWMW